MTFLIRNRLKLTGHVWQAEESLIKKITDNKLMAKRSRGRDGTIQK